MNISMITDDYTINDWAGHAVMSLSEGSEVNIGVEEGKLVHWECIKGGMEKPTEQEIANEVTRLKELYASLDYARKRKEEYDQLNQFELIGEDSINGTTKHKEAILAIKAKYPKE